MKKVNNIPLPAEISPSGDVSAGHNISSTPVCFDCGGKAEEIYCWKGVGKIKREEKFFCKKCFKKKCLQFAGVNNDGKIV